jgi:hypothetical protein
MGLFGSLLKKKGDEEKKEIKEKSNQNPTVSSRAKDLIEELVSPLSKPNQQLINEVLTIITQTSQLPDTMVNKEEVQKITKKLLFQLVEPISNPNKQLIDELIQLINMSGSKMINDSGSINSGNNNQNNFLNNSVNNNNNNNNNNSNINPGNDNDYSKNEDYNNKIGSSNDKERVIKGHAGLKQRHMQAAAQAPFPSDISSSKEKENKSIMNLLLEQIKELITITNGLNSKLKTHQVRLDSFDSSIQEIKKKSHDFDERMLAFEKNMEKFIGLYEVVTNQYNPFVETNTSDVENLNYKRDFEEKDLKLEKINDSLLVIQNQNIKDLSSLSDVIILMSDDDFETEIIKKKEVIFNWIENKFQQTGLVSTLSLANSKLEWLKIIMKELSKD